MTDHPTEEHRRVAQSSLDAAGPWKAIGPYLSERAWGSVREDYSADGDAWRYFPYEHGRSRAYRWNEDGLAGLCDIEQRMCFALALWNGRDPFLKERLFGLTGPEGNHGEDVKEYWWYADATPTASWLAWRYVYPHAAFPYDLLRTENARRGKEVGEFELGDTGVFDGGRYWDIRVEYAKASPEDVCVRIRVRNAGPEAETLHVLPTLWFRNRWSWGDPHRARPSVRAAPGGPGSADVLAQEERLGTWRLSAGSDPLGRMPGWLFCENETNVPLLFGAPAGTPYPKDGINDHVVSGAATVNPDRVGTKAACWYRLQVAPGETVELRLRLARDSGAAGGDLGAGFERVMADRERDADAFFAALSRPDASEDARAVMRQAFAGMVWNQQFYHFDVSRWLQGDPGQPAPPEARKGARNAQWHTLDSHDVIAMPDKWEYPWFAAWDLGFHCVTLACLDPAAAKHQLLLMLREWYMHPNGQLPAYEWNFGDVNPPVHAWAVLKVFEIDGSRDFDFLARAFHKLLINFTWWINRKDAMGNNIFSGGFLGLDNIGPFDRSATLAGGAILQQVDGTAWMAKYCLNMLEMALRLANRSRAYEDVALKFFEHFARVSSALQTLWNDEDGFFYSRVLKADGSVLPVRERSMVGLLPVFAAVRLDATLWQQLPGFRDGARWFIDHKPELCGFMNHHPHDDGNGLIGLVDPQRLRRVLQRMRDEDEFLSPYGLRSLSRWHLAHPLEFSLDGQRGYLDYEPAESRSGLFGGNSNWRGPVWFPLNYLAVESLRNLGAFLGDAFRVEFPSGSGHQATLGEVADALQDRLVGLFLCDAQGRRPAHRSFGALQDEPAWRDGIQFFEYFHGDDGTGLGASHQTGWTALVATMLARAPAASGNRDSVPPVHNEAVEIAKPNPNPN